VNIQKEPLVRAIKSTGLFSKTGVNDINLLFKKNKLIIKSSSSQLGENITEVDCSIKGVDSEIFVNYKYLLEGLNNIDSDEIIFKIVDNNTPCIIKSPEDNNFFYLIMPIKQ